MTSKELQQYLLHEFPQENARCEWKEMKNLKNSFAGDAKDDVISYVSAIANMDGGYLVVGVQDKTLEIVGTDLSKFNLSVQSAVWKLLEHCTNLSSEGLSIDEYLTEDTQKTVWIIHIPKHLPRRPVYAHKKAWQRVEDSLVEMTQERLAVILEEPIFEAKDWSAEIVPNATLADLDELAVAKARVMFKKVHASKIPAEEIDAWTVEELLCNCGIMVEGKLTRAAIILLGNPVSVFKLRPAVAEITWTLRDEQQEVVDYEHFTILLDAIQKGHRIADKDVLELLERGLLEGDISEYGISLDMAKKTRQLPHYTRNKGLDKAKLQQMILQYIQNAGTTGTKRDAIFDYLKDVLPKTKTEEQQERMVGNILAEMKEAKMIMLKGRMWYMN